MEILNIGPLELIIILVIMFILLGPKEMIATAQRIGKFVRDFVHSPMWREIMGYTKEIRDLPKMIMDETGLQETLDEVRKTTQQTADELNAQLKEATDAARVPEIEHLRIDPAKDTQPAAANKKTEAVNEPAAIVSSTEDTPVDGGESAAEIDENPAASAEGEELPAAVVPTALETPLNEAVQESTPSVDNSVIDQPVNEPAAVVELNDVSSQSEPEPSKNGKAKAETVLAVKADGDAEVDIPVPPSEEKPAAVKKPRRKKVDAVNEDGSAEIQTADAASTTAKRPRRKKAEAVTASSETAAVDSAAAEPVGTDATQPEKVEKPKRTTRRKKTEPTAEDGSAAAVSVNSEEKVQSTEEG